MTGNARLENVSPSLEVVRISNHTLKGMTEANSWKHRSKLFQPSEINHLYDGSKPSKLFLRLFQSLRYFSVFCVIILVEYFVLFMLYHCYWILINYFFNLTKVWLYNLNVLEGRFAFVLPCA